jgi:hypothetical protein
LVTVIENAMYIKLLVLFKQVNAYYVESILIRHSSSVINCVRLGRKGDDQEAKNDRAI